MPNILLWKNLHVKPATARNIIGSNIFNFAILFVADIFSFSKGVDHIYILNADSQYLLIFGIIATVTTLGMTLIIIIPNRN